MHLFTNEEYFRLVEQGVLSEDAKVELLDGRIVDVSPQSPEHARVTRALLRWFAARADLLGIQMPLVAAEGWVPEPDVVLAEEPDDGHPQTAQLVVEVVVTQHREAELKTPGYALAGVGAYWVVDVPDRSVTVHDRPSGDRFERVITLRGDDVLDPHVDGIPPRTVEQLLHDARV